MTRDREKGDIDHNVWTGSYDYRTIDDFRQIDDHHQSRLIVNMTIFPLTNHFEGI